MATAFRNVDFPDAFEPVIKTGRDIVMEFGTASVMSG